MKLRICYLFGFVITATCVTADLVTSEEVVQRYTPLKTLNGDSINIGEIPMYGFTNGIFHLENPGDTTVRVQRVVSTCGCMHGEISTNEIPPKSTVTVTLVLDASKVHGPFKRGVWLHFSDATHRPVSLSISGIASPLFAGFPLTQVDLVSQGTKVTLTNQFELKSLKPNISLGEPTADCPKELAFSYTLVTNQTGENTAYTLTTRVTPIDEQQRIRQTVRLSLPIIGTPQPATPLLMRLHVGENGSFFAVPNKIGLNPKHDAGTQTFRLLLRSRKISLDHVDQLTWDPLPEGVTLNKKLIGRRKHSISVMITITPEAAAKILANDDDPQEIQFHYPDQPPVSVSFCEIDTSNVQQHPLVQRSLTQRLNSASDEE